MTPKIPDHLRAYDWYAPHQAYLRDLGRPHHDPGDAAPVRASLVGASLDDASLVGASLVGASLVRASLVGARLDGASLVRASLVGARLDGASLDGASLDDARLDGASLVGARLDGARLDGARGLPDVAVPGLAAAVLRQIEEHPETHDQGVWHSECRTRHCAAGWCVELGGKAAKAIEPYFGTPHAARLALGLPLSAPTPFGGEDDPLPWLRELAEKEGQG